MKPEEYKISAEKFVFAKEKPTHDSVIKSKPIGYFHDAFNRFKKNKASIVAAVIIIILVIFAIISPIVSPYTVAYSDAYFSCVQPKSEIASALGLDFWDGCTKETVNEFTYNYAKAIGVETGHYIVKNGEEITPVQTLNLNKKLENTYTYRQDSYQKNGVIFMDITAEEYQLIQQYQNETGIQVIYPYTNSVLRPKAVAYAKDANFWYETEFSFGKTTIVLDENGNYKNIYEAYDGTDDYNSIRVEDGTLYNYAEKIQSGYKVRVLYYEYYIFDHSYVLKDGITKPSFLFGTTGTGKDVFTCLGGGARFSFLLAICVASVNLVVGAIYGAIEGYYGGKVDLVMERIVEILYDIPFIVVITLLKYHMASSSHLLILFIAFFLTGWIGMAGKTRMQFYRFKNQEYVLAARTLGAKDLRIMFRHIFPNALGTLVTSCVLVIPGMIFSESTLSYLGIINLESGNLTSVGTLLANAKPYMTSYPYMMVPAALFICLLMLSFNLFGNGLRDAFNPSLRGTE